MSYNFVLVEEMLCDLHTGQHACALHDICMLPT